MGAIILCPSHLQTFGRQQYRGNKTGIVFRSDAASMVLPGGQSTDKVPVRGSGWQQRAITVAELHQQLLTPRRGTIVPAIEHSVGPVSDTALH